ncbi:membrane-associated protein, putative [Bodo saltans]|uniref:Membrane-associated protein, putative n=1 Tax=Bodo saltans TaxID=75058 RepID=A0A0S4J6T8_BODSA|nr:membrane-associated protein, putative [Bodo saltans]|eukprot:CUG85792.1 membrane-associated protein, putative [Bodo saltans]
MVIGNVGLIVLLSGVHYLVAVVRSQQQGPAEQRRPSKSLPLPSPLWNIASQRRTATNPSAFIALRFPHYSMLVTMLLLPGVAKPTRRDENRGDVPGVVGGVIAAVVLLGALWMRLQLIGKHPSVVKLAFTKYKRDVSAELLGPYLRKLPSWVVPSGRWLPQSCAATHGRARSAVIGGREWLSEYAVVYTVAMNFVSGLPLSATECGVVFGVACIIPLTGLVAMIWRRPCRVPLLTWLNALQYLFTFVTTLLTSYSWAGVNGADGGAL